MSNCLKLQRLRIEITISRGGKGFFFSFQWWWQLWVSKIIVEHKQFIQFSLGQVKTKTKFFQVDPFFFPTLLLGSYYHTVVLIFRRLRSCSIYCNCNSFQFPWKVTDKCTDWRIGVIIVGAHYPNWIYTMERRNYTAQY